MAACFPSFHASLWLKGNYLFERKREANHQSVRISKQSTNTKLPPIASSSFLPQSHLLLFCFQKLTTTASATPSPYHQSKPFLFSYPSTHLCTFCAAISNRYINLASALTQHWFLNIVRFYSLLFRHC